MILFSQPLFLLLLVPALGATFFIWARGRTSLSAGRRRSSLALRCAIVTLVVLALAGLAWSIPQSRQAVVFVADTSASNLASEPAMKAVVAQATSRRPADGMVGVVQTGGAALVEDQVSRLAGFAGFQSSVPPDSTNLEAGLELASAILPDGYRRRIVLLSDGQQNAGDAVAAAKLLRARGIRLDVLPETAPTGPEVLVAGVDLPPQLQPHQRYSVRVTLRSNVATSTRLDLYRDRTLVLTRNFRLHLGTETYTFSQPGLQPGFHTYNAIINPQDDTRSQNNRGSAFVEVQAAPQILVLSDSGVSSANVVNNLRVAGFHVKVQSPSQVVPQLRNLQRYAAIVLVDESAESLGLGLMAELVPYVHDLGRGLLVIGGENSYAMGAYTHTPLEQLLPVKTDLPKRKQVPTVALALIVESLEKAATIDVSKVAAKGAVKLLSERDQVAVSDAHVGGNDPGWVVPLQKVAAKTAIEHAIDKAQPDDPQSYLFYLQAAYGVLRGSNAKVKHILLLGDGDAYDRRYQAFVTDLRTLHITVSTVGTNMNGPADRSTMRDVARWGGGRFYRADDPKRIPQILIKETRKVARPAVTNGTFVPQELAHDPALGSLQNLPALTGYVTSAPKRTAQEVLVSQKHDPLLATWQYGLGRTVAWTSDASGLWTRSWLRARNTGSFWSTLVNYILPGVHEDKPYVATSLRGNQAQLTVDLRPGLGNNPRVTAHVVDPNLQASTLSLQPVSPSHYSALFPATAQGAYFLTVIARGPRSAQSAQLGFDVPYSPEYRVQGTDLHFLQTLSKDGGGSIITNPASAWADNLPSVSSQQELTNALWLLALLLLPVDIAVRRLIVIREDLLRLREKLSFGSGASPSASLAAATTRGQLLASKRKRG